MAQDVQAATLEAFRDTVPFLLITAVWIVITLIMYGVFMVTKPGNVSYDAWVYASVFVVPGIGFLGHVLHQAFKGIEIH